MKPNKELAREEERSLRDAVRQSDTASLKACILRGADLDSINADGRTVLIWAVFKGRVGGAKLVLDAKAAVNKANEFGWTPLHSASYHGQLECAKV